MLVLINPNAGAKRASKIYDSIVHPDLSSMGYSSSRLKVYTTTHQGHVSEIIQNQQESDLKEILLLGGDGLIHETIQGILSQGNHPPQIQLRIIPCGTGNALAHSLGIHTIQDGINYIKEGSTPKPLKLSNVYVNDSFLDIMFCVFSWGFHSQIIRQSESLRFLGNIRFFLVALWNLLCKKRYTCTLNGQLETFTYFLATKMKFLEQGFKISPNADFTRDEFDLVTTGDISRYELGKWLLSIDPTENHLNNPSAHHDFKTQIKLVLHTQNSRTVNDRCIHDICIDGELYTVFVGDEIRIAPMETVLFYV